MREIFKYNSKVQIGLNGYLDLSKVAKFKQHRGYSEAF